MTVTELLSRATSHEIEEWKALIKIENSERQLAKQHAEHGFS